MIQQTWPDSAGAAVVRSGKIARNAAAIDDVVRLSRAGREHIALRLARAKSGGSKRLIDLRTKRPALK